VQRQGFDWMLYPFFEGANGFERALSDAQWSALGAALGAIHRTELPRAARKHPRERYAHQWREGVRRYQRRFINGLTGDAIVQRFFAFWEAARRRDRHHRLPQRAARLHPAGAAAALVPCHADIHAGNVLLGDGERWPSSTGTCWCSRRRSAT
jgi:spectinomycin phosphotransferase